MHVQLYELAQKYGSVMKIYIFTKPVVVLNTADVIHEALIKRGMVYFSLFTNTDKTYNLDILEVNSARFDPGTTRQIDSPCLCG